MRLLLDTTVLIDALRGRPSELFEATRASSSPSELMTSVISVAEVYAGMRRGEESRTEALVEELICLPVSKEISIRAGELVRVWARKGRTLELPDMLVAATALEHDLTLMTHNQKDFPMRELSLYARR